METSLKLSRELSRKIQRLAHTRFNVQFLSFHYIVPEKEKALRVCDESYKPVVESELWVFRQALDILGCAPINEFFSREA